MKRVIVVHRGKVAECWRLASRLRAMGYVTHYVPPQGKKKAAVACEAYDAYRVSELLALSREYARSGGAE